MAQIVITLALTLEDLTAENVERVKTFEALIAPVPVRTTSGESNGQKPSSMSDAEFAARKLYKEKTGKNFRLTKDHVQRGVPVVEAIAKTLASIDAGGAIPENGDTSDDSLPDADSVEIY